LRNIIFRSLAGLLSVLLIGFGVLEAAGGHRVGWAWCINGVIFGVYAVTGWSPWDKQVTAEKDQKSVANPVASGDRSGTDSVEK
jgi:hypothetical protein